MVNIRDYEVSIWTLQDSFITVLKQSNLENRGKIQDPKIVLKDDGENTFSFKIPMYLQEDSDLAEKPYFKDELIWKENPIWYTVRNGNLIASLRKVKVIFNKGASDEEVFEFIINNIKESHEGYSKFCEVECGGLAFHELGKQGYEIVLSDEEFLADYYDWVDGILQEEPIKNIDYWVKKVLDNSNWTYEINMDWSQYDGITDKTSRAGNSSVRQSNKVYRDPYISSWQFSDNGLIANSSVTDISQLEKKITVDAKESNRYNLLQSIAEAFQVFCKFKYLYDDNYHIIGRKVIFYNNFISEADGIVDFNYGYNTSQITREMDGTDLISKMYVSPLRDSGTFTGEINLSDTVANPTLDNFLLNFDYLYKIGTISQEQYDEIKIFQAALRNLNNQIKEKNEELIGYINQQPLEESKLKTAEDLSSEAGERINEAQSAIKSLQLGGANENTGLITIDGDAPRLFVIIHDSKSDSRYYININKSYRAFILSTFELYKSVNANGAVEGNPISGLQFERDEDGYISKVTFPIDDELSNLQQVYATFQYNPFTPYNDVKNIWTAIQGQANTDVKDATEVLNGKNNQPGLYTLIDNCESDLKTFAAERQELIKKFERLMGPALREGTWQPEDEYADYKTNKIFSILANTGLTSINSSSDTAGTAAFKWDNNQLSYDEQKISYQFGAETRYYPCIDLSGVNLSTLNVDNLNLVFRDVYLGSYSETYPENDPRVNHYLQVGSDTGCKFAFIREKNTTTTTIIPVLMIVGVKTMTDAIVYDEGSPTSNVIAVENQVKRSARLSAITYSNGELNETRKISTLTWINNSDLSNYEVVYPRFYLPIDNYITTEPEDKIYINNTTLEEYKDYYSLYHGLNYWITLKPESIIFNLSARYSFHYAITNAAEAMYLDAVEILRENSVPKVSYIITPLATEQSFIKNAYSRLGQLAHINDQELKFENVQGYISEVDLELDKPWEDTYVIKNYKTKFEDLFSTIVAQTEAMKKNSQLFNMVSNAFNTNGLLENTIVDDVKNRLNIYVPTPTEIYLQYEPQIREELRQAFTEAGEVLAAAQSSVNDVNNLNIANAAILGSFVENIKANMTPTTFTGTPRSSADFKVGDIWKIGTNEYLATQNSSQIVYSNGENKLTSLKGWSLVKDGSLAQIKGAKFDLNSENGTIQFEAETIISAKSGGNIALQANNDILIQANNTVDINGAQINLNSLSSTDPPRGILIQAVNNYNNKTASSKIDIKSSGIKMMTAGGISMAGAGGINIYTSDNTFSGTSAISISKDKGIYIGSGKSIILYSGEVPADITSSNYASKGASVLIDKDKILFGVTSKANNDTNNQGTAVSMTSDKIVIGAAPIVNSGGTGINDIGTSTTTTYATSGVYIDRTAIRLATGTGTNRSLISMSSTGILISTQNYNNMNSVTKGSYISLSNEGKVIIGVAGNVQTNSNTGMKTLAENATKARFEVYAPNFIVDENGHLYAYEANIAGTIRATSGEIGGWFIGSSALYLNNAIPGQGALVLSKGTTSTNSIGGSSGSKTWMISASNKFGVTTAGDLYANSANITGAITATSFVLSGNASVPQGKVDGLESALSSLQTDINNTKAVSGTVRYAISVSGILNNNNPPSDITNWSTNPVTATDSKPYLWTRTVITYASGNTSTSYSISYKGTNGTNGKYITTVTPLYYLKNNTTAPNKPTQKITSSTTNATSDTAGGWRIIVPTYQSNYTYFRCDQQEYDDGSVEWTDVYKDGGLTVANSTATSASKRAAALVALTGHTFTDDNITSSENYSLKLTATKRMLIGANSGIDIWNTNDGSGGTAISLDSDGIALNGASINLTATDGNTTSVISLNGNGIDLGATGTLKINTSNFSINADGNVSVKGNITATSGSIGGTNGWIITNNFLYSKSLKKTGATATWWTDFSGQGIALFSNEEYSEIHAYKNNTNYLNINTAANTGNNYNFVIGDYSATNPTHTLGLTGNGDLILKGNLKVEGTGWEGFLGGNNWALTKTTDGVERFFAIVGNKFSDNDVTGKAISILNNSENGSTRGIAIQNLPAYYLYKVTVGQATYESYIALTYNNFKIAFQGRNVNTSSYHNSFLQVNGANGVLISDTPAGENTSSYIQIYNNNIILKGTIKIGNVALDTYIDERIRAIVH